MHSFNFSFSLCFSFENIFILILHPTDI